MNQEDVGGVREVSLDERYIRDQDDNSEQEQEQEQTYQRVERMMRREEERQRLTGSPEVKELILRLVRRLSCRIMSESNTSLQLVAEEYKGLVEKLIGKQEEDDDSMHEEFYVELRKLKIGY
jgi:hypothetical protein